MPQTLVGFTFWNGPNDRNQSNNRNRTRRHTRTAAGDFLDFEGVFCFPDGTWSVEAVLELNRLCVETGAAIVLTTSARYLATVEELHPMLLANGLSKDVPVLGETRDLDAYRAAEKRDDLRDPLKRVFGAC